MRRRARRRRRRRRRRQILRPPRQGRGRRPRAADPVPAAGSPAPRQEDRRARQGHARGGTTRVRGTTGEDRHAGGTMGMVRGGTARGRCWLARGAGAPPRRTYFRYSTPTAAVHPWIAHLEKIILSLFPMPRNHGPRQRKYFPGPGRTNLIISKCAILVYNHQGRVFLGVSVPVSGLKHRQHGAVTGTLAGARVKALQRSRY